MPPFPREAGGCGAAPGSADRLRASPRARRTEPEHRCQAPGQVSEAVGALLPPSFRERPARLRRREPDAAAPARPRLSRGGYPGTPKPASPDFSSRAPRACLGLSPRRSPRAERPDPLPPSALPRLRPACDRLPPSPSPQNQQRNTTFCEKKTNFSDVTHLWCSGSWAGLAGPEGRRGGRGGSHTAPRRTDTQPAP